MPELQVGRANSKSQPATGGYTWFFFPLTRASLISMLFTLLVFGGSLGFFLWFIGSGNPLVASNKIGLSYALAGLMFLLISAISYTIHRHFLELHPGQLNRVLTRHGFFGLLGLALLFLHAAGDFSLKSGTLALAGMILLTLSGLCGRVLDRVMAWRIAIEMNTILTREGEDRQEILSETTNNMVQTHQNKLVRKRAQQPTYLIENQLEALAVVRQAKRKEQYYRSFISGWRKVHIGLAYLTLALTLWHVVVELPLLGQALFGP